MSNTIRNKAQSSLTKGALFLGAVSTGATQLIASV